MDENNNNKLEKNENTKDSKKYIEKSDNNIKDSQFSNLANKFNAINAATSYASALTSLQYTINKILPKDYINTMSTSLLQIQNILPHNDMKIMSEILLRKNYLTDMFFKHNINILTEGLTNKIYLSNAVNNIVSQNNILDNIKNINIYYKDTIESCMNEILNAKIDLTDLYIKSNFTTSFLAEDVENFSEEDKKETIKNVKEIVALAKENSENKEQLLNKKITQLKQEHPITFSILPIIFQLLLAILPMIFTQNSNEYYTNNYYTNNVVVVENSSQDFIDNARYVIAENLNVRSGAGKEYNVLTILKYGTVVKVKEKVKHWTKIEYIDKDNDINLEGWVYTRYLEKFDMELLQ